MPVRALLAVPGVLLIGLALVDTILTAIRVDRRGGPVTRYAGRLLWRAFHGGGSQRQSGPPPVTGVLITIAIVGMWALLALSGWYLLFSSDANAVVSSTTGQPADPWARLYFTGYTLSTLGLGDYVPSGAPWQVLTGLASGFGFGIATLVITYLAGVASAVTAKRQLARSITGMGDSPQQIVHRAWNGEHFRIVQQHLLNLLPLLHGVAEQHRAYPLISYFKSSDRATADVPAVALLHDTLAILSATEDEHRIPELITAPAYEAIDAYLYALPGSDADPEELDTPPWPDVEDLREAGVPVRPFEELDESDDARRRRRAARGRHAPPGLGLARPRRGRRRPADLLRQEEFRHGGANLATTARGERGVAREAAACACGDS